MSALVTHRRRGRARTGACEQAGGSGRSGIEATPTLFEALEAVAAVEPPPVKSGGAGATLGDLIGGIWEDLAAHEHVACPMCGGEMTPHFGAHARPTDGRCADCGTTLS